jgi:hypothetical protein
MIFSTSTSFWNFNNSLNDLFNDLLNWNLFSDGFFLRNNDFSLSWDFNYFLLDDEFFLVDNISLNNFDNLVNNSFDFLTLVFS